MKEKSAELFSNLFKKKPDSENDATVMDLPPGSYKEEIKDLFKSKLNYSNKVSTSDTKDDENGGGRK